MFIDGQQPFRKTSLKQIRNCKKMLGNTSNIDLKIQQKNGDDFIYYIFYIKISIIAIGLFGNVLCLLIWIEKSFIKMSRSSTCIALAVVNFCYLLINFTSEIYWYVNGKTLNERSEFLCKSRYILNGTFGDLDAWLIVTLTLERLCAVCVPYKAKLYITRRRMTIFISLLTLVSLLFNGYLGLFERNFFTVKGKTVCRNDQNVITTIKHLLRGMVPLTIVIISNIIIIVKILQQKRKLKVAKAHNENEVKKSLRLTYMVLSITISFFILMMPPSIYWFCCKNIANYRDINRVIKIFPEINASINFFLYSLSSRDVQRAVARQLAKFCKFCPAVQNVLLQVNTVTSMAGTSEVSTKHNANSKTKMTGVSAIADSEI